MGVMANNPLESSNSQNKNLIEQFRQEAQRLIDETFIQIKERYRQLVDIGHSYGLDDDSIDWILQDLLSERINKRTLYNYRREYLQLENLSEIADKKVIEDSSVDEDNEPASQEIEEHPEPSASSPREEAIEDAEIVGEDVFGEYDVTVYFAGKDVTMKANITRDSFVMVGPNKWVRIIINKRK